MLRRKAVVDRIDRHAHLVRQPPGQRAMIARHAGHEAAAMDIENRLALIGLRRAQPFGLDPADGGQIHGHMAGRRAQRHFGHDRAQLHHVRVAAKAPLGRQAQQFVDEEKLDGHSAYPVWL